MSDPADDLVFPYEGPPASAAIQEVAPGVYWLQMPLPMSPSIAAESSQSAALTVAGDEPLLAPSALCGSGGGDGGRGGGQEHGAEAR